MFEDKTTDNVHAQLLSNISDDYEKSVGNLAYDLTKSFAIQEEGIYKSLQLLLSKIDVDNLKDDELTKYVYQRKGIIRKPSTKSIGTVTVMGNGTINAGDLFETISGIQFKSLKTLVVSNTAIVEIEAIKEGTIGNVGANSIILMPVTIAGITEVTNLTATHGGYEAENDESLRERYYEALKRPPTSANKWHYIFWSKEVTGVGNAKVFPLWNGDNTVQIVIIDSNKHPANTDLVEQVQEYIDPNSGGLGEGQAPIGAYCTVISATPKQVNIGLKLIKLENYTDEQIVTNISTKITDYLKEIAFKQDYISYAKIGSLILDSYGVEDWIELHINNTTSNISIGEKEVAVLGQVTLI